MTSGALSFASLLVCIIFALRLFLIWFAWFLLFDFDVVLSRVVFLFSDCFLCNFLLPLPADPFAMGTEQETAAGRESRVILSLSRSRLFPPAPIVSWGAMGAPEGQERQDQELLLHTLSRKLKPITQRQADQDGSVTSTLFRRSLTQQGIKLTRLETAQLFQKLNPNKSHHDVHYLAMNRAMQDAGLIGPNITQSTTSPSTDLASSTTQEAAYTLEAVETISQTEHNTDLNSEATETVESEYSIGIHQYSVGKETVETACEPEKIAPKSSLDTRMSMPLISDDESSDVPSPLARPSLPERSSRVHFRQPGTVNARNSVGNSTAQRRISILRNLLGPSTNSTETSETLRLDIVKHRNVISDALRDENSGGFVKPVDLKRALSTVGVRTTETAADRLFKSWDSVGAGQIQLDEFQRILRRNQSRLSGLRISGNQRRSLSPDLRRMKRSGPQEAKVLKRLREQLATDLADLPTVFNRWDENGDGIVTLADFTRSLPSMGIRAGGSNVVASVFQFLGANSNNKLTLPSLQRALESELSPNDKRKGSRILDTNIGPPSQAKSPDQGATLSSPWDPQDKPPANTGRRLSMSYERPAAPMIKSPPKMKRMTSVESLQSRSGHKLPSPMASFDLCVPTTPLKRLDSSLSALPPPSSSKLTTFGPASEQSQNWVFENMCKPQAPMTFIRIAETVLIRDGQVFRWLFTAADGSVKSKRSDKLNSGAVRDAFETEMTAGSFFTAVMRTAESTQLLDKEGLRDAVYNLQSINSMQRYIESRGGNATRHRCTYTFSLEMHRHRVSYSKLAYIGSDGVDAHRAGARYRTIDDERSEVVEIRSNSRDVNERLDAATRHLVQRCEYNARCLILHMSADFIIDASDQLWFVNARDVVTRTRSSSNRPGKSQSSWIPTNPGLQAAKSLCMGDHCNLPLDDPAAILDTGDYPDANQNSFGSQEGVSRNSKCMPNLGNVPKTLLSPSSPALSSKIPCKLVSYRVVLLDRFLSAQGIPGHVRAPPHLLRMFDAKVARKPELFYRSAHVCERCFQHYTVRNVERSAEMDALLSYPSLILSKTAPSEKSMTSSFLRSVRSLPNFPSKLDLASPSLQIPHSISRLTRLGKVLDSVSSVPSLLSTKLADARKESDGEEKPQTTSNDTRATFDGDLNSHK